ncbi:MAG: hypothetical protein EOP20_00010 [Hyphomicrobiales bacterium]|nr:MAG: hypothetical protein EOP20_00010 [Hyphomicrobiales bacterium]
MSDHEGAIWRRNWLALDDERIRHLDTWSGILRQLERQPGWFDLTEQERDLAEQVSGLKVVDKRLRVIDRRLRRWLRVMPTGPVHDLTGVVANLQVAERLLPPEESPIVHGLIARAVRDLSQIGQTG